VSDLPDGWAEAKLEQVAEWGSGGTPSRSRSDFYGGKIPWIKTGELGQGLITDTEEKITVEALNNSSAKVFPRGSVAIAMYGATIGKVATLGIDAATNQACAVGIPISGVTTTKYLLHYLASQKSEFVAKGQGGAQPNISQAIIRSWPIRVAPFKEQERIVKKLDSLLSKVDTCQSRLDRVPQILKKFREAVLEAAVSGKLTEAWRLARGISLDGWSTGSIGELVEKIEAGLNVQCDERPPKRGEKGLVKISAVTWGEFDEDESKTLPKDSAVTEAVRIMNGDLLISRANTLELVGACVIVDSITRRLYLSDKVLRLRAADHVKPWLLISLRSRSGRRQIETLASGNQLSMRNLSQDNLRSITVAVPSPDERTEIVRRVYGLMGIAKGLATHHAGAVAQVERLAPSVLGKAFRGELVPQDPNDEPAAEMLERIRRAHGSADVNSRSQVKSMRRMAGRPTIQGGRRSRASSA
jgi:type I restriction enzyme S subunit